MTNPDINFPAETRSERTARIREEFAAAEAKLDAQTAAEHQAHWDAGCP